MSDDAAVWAKIDKLGDDVNALRLELSRQDYRMQIIEQRFERVVEKIAESRGEAHNEAVRISTQLERLTKEVSEARGGLRFGKWAAGIFATMIAIGVSIWATIKGGA